MTVSKLIWGIYLIICWVIIGAGCMANSRTHSVIGDVYIFSYIYWGIVLVIYAIYKWLDRKN